MPADEPIYVYCYTAQTAGQTVAGLRMLGYDVYVFYYSTLSGWIFLIAMVAGEIISNKIFFRSA